MNILFLSRWFPYPANNGSKLRIYNLLRGLAQHHTVTLLSFVDQSDISPDLTELRSLCSDVYTVPWREFNPQSSRARWGFLSLKPRSVIDTFSREMAQKITQLCSTHDYDLVIASELAMAAYRPYFRRLPALFEELELGVSYGESHHSSDFKKRFRRTFTWFKLRMYLSQLLDSFQACSVVSEPEKRLLVHNFSRYRGIVQVVPNCVHVNGYESHQSAPVSNQLIFSGSFRYQANYQAMLWFVGEVFPKVLERIPDAHLIITGEHANLPLPPVTNVTLVGHVPDIHALIASSWVSLAPLLSGGGTRLKILEAMAIGTPVVSTSKGAEGLDATVGEHLLVADTPHEFADEVVKILRSRDLRDQVAAKARQLVKAKYDWDAVMPRFLQLLERIVM
jgi:glycosyltransferase involved in cell wall biosynthesis